jgi:hypothetical protein
MSRLRQEQLMGVLQDEMWQVPPEQTSVEQENPMHDAFGTSSEDEEGG